MTRARLIVAIISTSLEEVAIWIIWRWGLPEMGINLPVPVLIGVMIAWLAFSAITFTVVTRVLRKQVPPGLPSMMGTRGKVASALAPEGHVRIKGELWSATAEEGSVGKGEEIMVVGEEGLKLVVRKSGDK